MFFTFYFVLVRQLQSYIAQDILEKLDAGSLNNAEQVCHSWREAISDADLWQKLYNKNVAVFFFYLLCCSFYDYKFDLDETGFQVSLEDDGDKLICIQSLKAS